MNDTKSPQPGIVPDSPTDVTKTSINVSTRLWNALKKKAIDRGLTAGDALEVALRYWLDHEAPVPASSNIDAA